jgi:ADP-heptose:LPS heptosyltransferase
VPERIAIFRNDHMGDLILTTGLARNLHKAGHEVVIFSKAIWRDVFLHNQNALCLGYGEKQVPYPNEPRELGRWIRKQRFDKMLIPYFDRDLLTASWYSGGRGRWAQMGGWYARSTLHHCLPSGIRRNPRHMADVWLDFARAQGITVDDGRPELFLSDEEFSNGSDKTLSRLNSDRYFVVHPFHGRSSCNWPLSRYVELVDLIIQELNVPVVLTGSLSEAKLLERYTNRWPKNRVWISCGELNLREFFSVIGGARLLICSSTGALHVSSALNIPSVSLFCPHPDVGPTLWRSFCSDAWVASPPPEHCPRYSRNHHCQDCSFPRSPSITEVLSRLKI